VSRGRLLLAALLLASANAALPAVVGEVAVPANIILPFLVCIIAGWLMAFQVGGVRASHDWKDWILFGPLAPHPRELVKPLPPSRATQIFVLALAASLVGWLGSSSS
jgi:hypothetical protein